MILAIDSVGNGAEVILAQCLLIGIECAVVSASEIQISFRQHRTHISECVQFMFTYW